ncbi:hypothetical protein SFUMM280S_03183 [Streptomyces fumanus]
MRLTQPDGPRRELCAGVRFVSGGPVGEAAEPKPRHPPTAFGPVPGERYASPPAARVRRRHVQHPVAVHRLLQHRAVHRALPGQLRQHRDDHRLRVDVEEPPRRAPGVRNPKPSAPSDWYVPGTHRAIWSGTTRIQSETATNGPRAPASFRVTYGTRCSSSGFSSSWMTSTLPRTGPARRWRLQLTTKVR